MYKLPHRAARPRAAASVTHGVIHPRAGAPLPPAARREEFRRHKKADQKWLVNFYREWDEYLRQLAQQSVAAGSLGRDMAPELVSQMNDEQKQQLQQLRTEAAALYKDG